MWISNGTFEVPHEYHTHNWKIYFYTMLKLQGHPELRTKNVIPKGRLYIYIFEGAYSTCHMFIYTHAMCIFNRSNSNIWLNLWWSILAIACSSQTLRLTFLITFTNEKWHVHSSTDEISWNFLPSILGSAQLPDKTLRLCLHTLRVPL